MIVMITEITFFRTTLKFSQPISSQPGYSAGFEVIAQLSP